MTQSISSILSASESLRDLFRSTNLERALRESIELGDLFIMPEACSFAYVRGSGSIELGSICLGAHETQRKDGSIDFNSPRFLHVTYRVQLIDDNDEERNERVNINVPNRFQTYVIHENDYGPKWEFKYGQRDFNAWVKETRTKLYNRAAKECRDKITKLTKRANELEKRAK